MAEIQFHRSDMCVVQGKKCAKLTTPEGTVFYNLWSNKGKWQTISALLTNFKGEPVPSENPTALIHGIKSGITAKLKNQGIKLEIETQYQSFWAETAYRIKKDD